MLEQEVRGCHLGTRWVATPWGKVVLGSIGDFELLTGMVLKLCHFVTQSTAPCTTVVCINCFVLSFVPRRHDPSGVQSFHCCWRPEIQLVCAAHAAEAGLYGLCNLLQRNHAGPMVLTAAACLARPGRAAVCKGTLGLMRCRSLVCVPAWQTLLLVLGINCKVMPCDALGATTHICCLPVSGMLSLLSCALQR